MNASAVARRLDDLLLPAGFTRRKMQWTRLGDRYIDTVDIQAAKSGDSLTVNVGVIDVAVYRRIWGDDPAAPLDSSDATVSARLGELALGHDHWWSFQDDDAVDEIHDLARDNLLPYIDSLHSTTMMEKRLEEFAGSYPPPLMALAILRYERGDKDGARAALEIPREPRGQVLQPSRRTRPNAKKQDLTHPDPAARSRLEEFAGHIPRRSWRWRS